MLGAPEASLRSASGVMHNRRPTEAGFVGGVGAEALRVVGVGCECWLWLWRVWMEVVWALEGGGGGNILFCGAFLFYIMCYYVM